MNHTSEIWFVPDDDPTELLKALDAEGYDVQRADGTTEAGDAVTVLTVQPFDDGVVAMVDVYGGWLPGDQRLRPTDGS